MESTASAQPQHRSRIQLRDLRSTPLYLFGLGSVLLILSIGANTLFDEEMSRWFHAFLLNLTFFLSISLGALFFVVLQHLTSARWSVVTRRIAELLTTPIATMGLLMLVILIPMFLGNSSLYSWNDSALRESDALIRSKTPYLNTPFFALRCLFYFVTWVMLSRFFMNRSLMQDAHSQRDLSDRMRQWSGPAMIALAITLNFAAFDWLMSLDPHWFSTIFGVYFFAGCVVSFLAVLAIAASLLQRFGFVTQEITVEHYHDIGKLLFGFMFFWAYIAFSQYLLIWYANIPEETVWYLHRQEHGWQYVGLLLLAGHLILPFFGLMSRSARRDRKRLLFWASFLLIMHWVDLYWIVMPNISPDSVKLGAIEVLSFLGVGCVWCAALAYRARNIRLIPTGDPNYPQSLSFHNV